MFLIIFDKSFHIIIKNIKNVLKSFALHIFFLFLCLSFQQNFIHKNNRKLLSNTIYKREISIFSFITCVNNGRWEGEKVFQRLQIKEKLLTAVYSFMIIDVS